MQRVVGVVLILVGLGWLASELPTAPAKQSPPEPVAWRRTCEGWQRADWLRTDLSREPPILHPAVLGLALLSFAMSALIGLSSEEESRGSDSMSLPPPA